MKGARVAVVPAQYMSRRDWDAVRHSQNSLAPSIPHPPDSGWGARPSVASDPADGPHSATATITADRPYGLSTEWVYQRVAAALSDPDAEGKAASLLGSGYGPKMAIGAVVPHPLLDRYLSHLYGDLPPWPPGCYYRHYAGRLTGVEQHGLLFYRALVMGYWKCYLHFPAPAELAGDLRIGRRYLVRYRQELLPKPNPGQQWESVATHAVLLA